MTYKEVIKTVDSAVARAKRLKLGACRVKNIPDHYVLAVSTYLQKQGHLSQDSAHFDGIIIYIDHNNIKKQ